MRDVIRMNHTFPTSAEILLLGGSGVFHPAWADVITIPVRETAPDQLGHRLCQGAEIRFAFPQCFFGLLAFRDIRDDAHHPARWLFMRPFKTADKFKPTPRFVVFSTNAT